MYTRGQAIDFITKIFGEGSLSNQGANISVVCPVCISKNGSFYNKRKLAIRTDNFANHCWVCNYKSRNLADLIKRYHPGYFTEYLTRFVGTQQLKFTTNNNNKVAEAEFKLPNGFQLLALPNKDPNMEIAYRSAISYIAKRFGLETKDLDPSHLWYWKFGIVLEDRAFVNRVIMPSFTIDGELNYFTGRAFVDVNPKYLNPHVQREDVIFNEININWKEPLTIVEGPFDLIKCNQNATCLLGSDLTTEYKLFLMLVKHKTPVILALDPDAKDKALKVAELLSEFDVPVSLLDIPAPYKDVGELTQTQFNSLLETVTPFSKDYLLRAKISRILKV
jgi:hypothetical protein